MKTSTYKHSLFISLLCIASLTLMSCEDEPQPQQLPEYGNIYNYLDTTSLDYPDFSLRFIEKKVMKPDLPDGRTLYLFWLAYGTNHRQLEWFDAVYRTASFEQFNVDEKTYYLELKESDFLGKTLKEGELIVWNQDQYNEHKEAITKSLTDRRDKIVGPIIEQERRQVRQLETKRILRLYKEYMRIINDGNPEFIDYYLTSLSSSGKQPPRDIAEARNKHINKLFTRLNPRWDSLKLQQISLSESKAKLYLEGQSEKEHHVIGAELVKEESEWKVAEDTILPTDAEGRQAITQFMQSD